MEWWWASGIFFRGWTRWHAGHRETGLADMRQGMALCRLHGLTSAPPIFQALIAEAEAGEGRIDEALAMLDELLAAIALSGEHWLRRRRTGSAGTSYGDAARMTLPAAEAALLPALGTARRQKTRVFELRAALDLAGLYSDLDQRAAGARRPGTGAPRFA